MNRYSCQVSGSLFHSITPNPYPPTIPPTIPQNSPTRSQTFLSFLFLDFPVNYHTFCKIISAYPKFISIYSKLISF